MRASWDPNDPLARMSGERTDANQALNDYALMGAGRSLAKLCDWYRGQRVGNVGAGSGGGPPAQPPTTRLPTLEAWSARYDWQRRVAAWQAIEAAKERELWEQRRREWRERAFELAQKLADKAEEMLKRPVPNEPTGWNFNTPPQMLAVADKLARLAAEMDTARERQLSWQDEVIQLIRDGVVTRADIERELDHDLAEELFRQAGIPTDENRTG